MERSTKKVTPILQQTSSTLNIDPATVDKVMDHHFSSLKAFLAHPTHGAYRLPYFGIFFVKPSWFYQALPKMIKKIRTTANPAYKALLLKDLSYLFINRHKLLLYAYSRKFKEIYGSWHFK